MNFNKKALLTLFLLFIVALSVSYVSAENIETNDINDVVINDVNNVASVADAKVWSISNGASQKDVQDTINNASAGDTIKFAANGVYKFTNNSGDNDGISVSKTLIFIGNNATITTGQGFLVQAEKNTTIAGTSFTGFNFIINNTNGAWSGRAIQVNGGSDINITNCSFIGGNAGIYLRGSTGKLLVANCYFNGTTKATTITPAGKGETGTKCINIMGGDGVKVINNTIVGSPLDALSIASNSKNILVDSNNITGAYYGIYYGGGLENITTTNNIFKDIRAYGIGLVKAAQYSTIKNNTFIMGTLPENGAYKSNAAIYLEQGNTAHGVATKIGDITIVDNKFSTATGVPANQTTYAVELYSPEGPLKLSGPFVSENNTFENGVTKFIFLDGTWDNTNGNVNIGQYTADSVITPEENKATLETGASESVQLTAADGTILPDQKVVLTVTQNNKTIKTVNATTNKFGIFEFVNDLDSGNYTIIASFAGTTYNNGIYRATTKSFDIISVSSTSKIATDISGNSLVKYYRNASQYIVTLTAKGQPIANETVYIFINGVAYTRVTKDNGTAKMTINLAPGNYSIHVAYLGNDKYSSCAAEDKITVLSPVIANNLTMTTNNRTPFTATILNGQGEYDVGNRVTFNINGIMYNRNVYENASGVVKVNINLAPGEYIMTCYYPVRYASTATSNVTLTQSWTITIKP